MTRFKMVWSALTAFRCLPVLAENVVIDVDRTEVPMGRTVRVTATVKDDAGRPIADLLLLPFVNERRWGSHEATDATGKARFLLPLPNPGPAEIQVLARPGAATPPSQWIWAGQAQAGQTVYFQKRFELSGNPLDAVLYVAVDDQGEVLLNGAPLGEVSGWSRPATFPVTLTPGVNVLSVKATNGDGPGALLAQLDYATSAGKAVVGTDATWAVWPELPKAWPGLAEGGAPATVIAPADQGPWAPTLKGWPGLTSKELLMVGRPMPAAGVRSNAVTVRVVRRDIAPQPASDQLIGMQWEPWFTPMNAYWQTAQAIPVIGMYDSYNRDVMRQHALWFMDLGIDFIMPDWSNHIWGKEHWNQRPEGSNEIIHATTLMLEALAEMRHEGLPVPRVVIMPGLSNGPPTTMGAMNEQLAWLHENYLRNPRFEGLWQDFDGKPLVVILDTALTAITSPVPVDESHFTVRWMSTQLQITKHEEKGYWTWMDGSLRPVPTYRDGKAEAITPTPAYFAEFGWTGEKARGRQGGTTYLESFKAALEHRPRVVLLHQWNEYAGQLEGEGYGPNKDRYVDSYSVELSDDLEPVSLTAPGYRRDKGGWGYFYHNLTKALLDIYRGNAPDDTLLAVGSPARQGTVSGDTLRVFWTTLGKAPTSFTILLDGRTVAEGLHGESYELSLRGVKAGAHTLTVVAEGVTTRYPLHHDREDDILPQGGPCRVDVPFTVREAA